MSNANHYSRVFAAHRYFIWAQRQLDTFIKAKGGNPYLRGLVQYDEGALRQFLLTIGPWLAALFVVIEACEELGLEDATVEKHLSDTENVSALRRFRNGVFHFQSTYYDDRLLDFLSKQGSIDWAMELHEAFSEYFKRFFGVEYIDV